MNDKLDFEESDKSKTESSYNCYPNMVFPTVVCSAPSHINQKSTLEENTKRKKKEKNTKTSSIESFQKKLILKGISSKATDLIKT